MRTLRFVLVSCLFIGMLQVNQAQTTTKVQVETGYAIFDARTDDISNSLGLQTGAYMASLQVYKTLDWGRTWRPRIGSGYSYFYYHDGTPILWTEVPDIDNLGHHFARINYGIEFHPRSRMGVGMLIDHYILIGRLEAPGHHRHFINILPMISFQTSERYELQVSIPFTLTPMFVGAYQGTIGSTLHEPRAEMNGIQIGLNIKI